MIILESFDTIPDMKTFDKFVAVVMVITTLLIIAHHPSTLYAKEIITGDENNPATLSSKEKRPVHALLLGIFIIGGAHYYAGDIKWGIISSLIGYTTLASAAYLAYFFYTSYSWNLYGTFLANLLPVTLFTVLILAASTTWAISLYSGYMRVKMKTSPPTYSSSP